MNQRAEANGKIGHKDESLLVFDASNTTSTESKGFPSIDGLLI
jgi:hypothetical protein